MVHSVICGTVCSSHPTWTRSESVMSKPVQQGPLIAGVLILVIAVIAVPVAYRGLYAATGDYTFSPCPGLTVTSTATTGIWNCPNQPVFTDGQAVTITGSYATGYGTLGCVPQDGEPCAVPQIASLQDYIYANLGAGMWFVVRWENLSVQLKDGQVVTVTGTLNAISYSTNPGATYPVFHLNNSTGKSDLLQPQPSFEILNAVLD